MTKEELWQIYCEKNPAFADPDAQITMTARGLKKLFEQTFDLAHDQGVKNGRALAAMEEGKTRPKTPLEEVFGKF